MVKAGKGGPDNVTFKLKTSLLIPGVSLRVIADLLTPGCKLTPLPTSWLSPPLILALSTYPPCLLVLFFVQ